MTTTNPAPHAVVETIAAHRNGSTGIMYYSATISDVLNGTPGRQRFLAHFAATIHPETGEFHEITRDANGLLVAFVTDLNAAYAGELDHSFNGDEMVTRWLPILSQAWIAWLDASADRIAAESAARHSRTLTTIQDALPRMGLPLTEEYVAAARTVMFPGLPRLEDDVLPNFREAIVKAVSKNAAGVEPEVPASA